MSRTPRYHAGQTFGDSLTLLAPVRSPNHSTLSWECRCLKCGHEFEASYAMLRKAEDSDYPLCPACTEHRPRKTKHKPFEPGYLLELCVRARREQSLMRLPKLLEKSTEDLRRSEGLVDFAPMIEKAIVETEVRVIE